MGREAVECVCFVLLLLLLLVVFCVLFYTIIGLICSGRGLWRSLKGRQRERKEWITPKEKSYGAWHQANIQRDWSFGWIMGRIRAVLALLILLPVVALLIALFGCIEFIRRLKWMFLRLSN